MKPPRNLIDLVQKAQDVQMRKEEREANEFLEGKALLSSDALKSGLSALSKQRVEDTLLAEAGAQAGLIDRFRNGKAEHNSETLASALGLEGEELVKARQFLRDIGFLEAVGANFKIPMLYREGLGVTQGKAFSSTGEADEEDEEEE